MKERQKRAIQTREALWPEVIESVISALYAGRSINQALMDLQNYGPQELAHVWQRMSARISEGDSLEKIFSDESRGLESPRADQFFATLIFAKNFGGHSVQLSLRHLAAFIRDDIQMMEEIQTRFGWVRNSAILAASAPWLLLLLLSAQPGTVTSFATSGGKAVLSCGVIATALAFLWMARISRIEGQPRVFEFHELSNHVE